MRFILLVEMPGPHPFELCTRVGRIHRCYRALLLLTCGQDIREEFGWDVVVGCRMKLDT